SVLHPAPVRTATRRPDMNSRSRSTVLTPPGSMARAARVRRPRSRGERASHRRRAALARRSEHAAVAAGAAGRACGGAEGLGERRAQDERLVREERAVAHLLGLEEVVAVVAP